MGIELEGMLDTYIKYGGEDIRKYCQEYTDTMINDKGDIRGSTFWIITLTISVPVIS